MSGPYREPGSAPSDEVQLNHDYIADVRRSRDPRGGARTIAIGMVVVGAVLALIVFLAGGSFANWLEGLAVVTAYLAVKLAIGKILMDRQDEKMHVADLLDGLDARKRR